MHARKHSPALWQAISLNNEHTDVKTFILKTKSPSKASLKAINSRWFLLVQPKPNKLSKGNCCSHRNISSWGIEPQVSIYGNVMQLSLSLGQSSWIPRVPGPFQFGRLFLFLFVVRVSGGNSEQRRLAPRQASRRLRACHWRSAVGRSFGCPIESRRSRWDRRYTESLVATHCRPTTDVVSHIFCYLFACLHLYLLRSLQFVHRSVISQCLLSQAWL